MTIKTEYIDVTPTWEQAAATLAHVMRDGTAEGQKLAAEQIIDMGRTIDRLQAHIKKQTAAMQDARQRGQADD